MTNHRASSPTMQPRASNNPTAWTAERLVSASYKDLGQPRDVQIRFLNHLLENEDCRVALESLLKTESSTTRDFSLELDVYELIFADPVLGQLLLKFPNTLLPILESAVVQAQRIIMQDLVSNENNQSNNEVTVDPRSLVVKGDKGNNRKERPATRVHARLFNLPPTCCRTSLGIMDADDVGKIVQISGTVVRTSPVQMYESARTYKCTGKNGCSRTFLQKADLEQRTNALVPPDRCPLTLESGQRCKGTNLKVEPEGSVHTDYQEIKIQEAASKIGVGSIPRSLMIKLQHDLVDRSQPGDEVVVVGSLLAQWQNSLKPDVECSVGMAIEAHSVQVVQENGSSAWNNSEASTSIQMENFKKEFDEYWASPMNQEYPIASRDFICRAVCPKLYGLHIIKLALLMTLIGGVSSTAYQDDDDENEGGSCSDPNHQSRETNAPQPFRMASTTDLSQTNTLYGDRDAANNSTTRKRRNQGHGAVETKRRDMSHILIIGDPGTGKSQILRFAAALCPRAVLTTGVGTTSAGLTCAAVREGDGKEFSLEAGALVLADKGICCIDEFGCIRSEDRTTIHEAMEQQTLSVAKAGIVCKLNCRATVVAVMNPRDCIYDNQASLSHNTGLGTPLLSRFDLVFKLVDTSDPERDGNVTTYLLNRAIQGAGFEVANHPSEMEKTPWSMEKLRSYIAIVKDRYQPVISDGAAILLERHYEKVRSAQSFVIPVTVRFLESLIRLTQAHARLLYRDVATLQDAVAVLRVMECSAYAYGGFEGDVADVETVLYCDPMDMDVLSLSPDEDFLVFEYNILKRYNMLSDMPDDRRNKALTLLEGEVEGDALGPDGADGGYTANWSGIENPREVQQQDHYGRSYFSPRSSQGSARKRPRVRQP